VSLITASLSYIIIKLLWLDFALFFALLTFILNFIPNVGSIIAVSLVALFSLIQLNSYYTFILIGSGLTSIHVLMWNIIEPKFMWNKLNLSPLVIILSLWFWWAIWWIVWMLLSVPIMVIINIILAKIPATRNIAILLSEKWELQIDWVDEVVKIKRRLFYRMIKKIIDIKK
jgi:predicted PurR-regulated permease PerM